MTKKLPAPAPARPLEGPGPGALPLHQAQFYYPRGRWTGLGDEWRTAIGKYAARYFGRIAPIAYMVRERFSEDEDEIRIRVENIELSIEPTDGRVYILSAVDDSDWDAIPFGDHTADIPLFGPPRKLIRQLAAARVKPEYRAAPKAAGAFVEWLFLDNGPARAIESGAARIWAMPGSPLAEYVPIGPERWRYFVPGEDETADGPGGTKLYGVRMVPTHRGGPSPAPTLVEEPERTPRGGGRKPHELKEPMQAHCRELLAKNPSMTARALKNAMKRHPVYKRVERDRPDDAPCDKTRLNWAREVLESVPRSDSAERKN
jgi:hypothetical protein